MEKDNDCVKCDTVTGKGVHDFCTNVIPGEIAVVYFSLLITSKVLMCVTGGGGEMG